MDDSSITAARRFCESNLWGEAVWVATTFRWHPGSTAPPVMGLVFADWTKGVELFRSWIDAWGNADEDNVIRIAIIEGDLPNQAPGYNVRISPNHLADIADEGEPILGQVQRMHPLGAAGIPGAPDMLPPFKREYSQHGEFLLAPTIIKEDGQLWFDVQYGVIKHELVLRHVSHISSDDPDADALRATDGSGLPPKLDSTDTGHL